MEEVYRVNLFSFSAWWGFVSGGGGGFGWFWR